MNLQRVTPTQAAFYARQSVEEDDGIIQQFEDCAAYAEEHGWIVPGHLEFEDNDVSGSRERGEKTGWQKMLLAFDRKEFNTLIVTQTSRLTRRMIDVIDIRPPRRNMRILVINDHIDTDTDDTTLYQMVLNAQHEAKVKAERAARYAKARREKGHPSAGMTPHGYSWVYKHDRDETGTRYVINDDEAKDVRFIFARYIGGWTIWDIAAKLNEEGRLTRQKKHWIPTTVRRILLNPLYAALLPPAQPTGEHKLKNVDLGKCVDGAWEPIVEREQLEGTRARLLAVVPKHNGTARKWLLSGLALCGVCNQPVRSAKGEIKPKSRQDAPQLPGKRYHAYRCHKGHFMRNGDLINELVTEVLIAGLSEPGAANMLLPKKQVEDVAALNAERERIKASRSRVYALAAATGDEEDVDAAGVLQKLGSDLSAVDQRIAQAVQRDPLSELATIDDVRAWWEKASLTRRRAVVSRFLEITIHRVGGGFRATELQDLHGTVAIKWKDSSP